MGVGSASTRKRSRSQIDGEAATSAGLDKCSELFQGCHFLFLQPLHMQRMMERIRQFGGEIHSSVTHDITHIITKSSASKEQIAAKLLGGPLAREAPSGPGSAASLQLSPGVHVVTPDFVAQSILQQQRQPETSFLPASLQPRPTPATTPGDVAPHSPPPQPPPHTPQESPQQQPSQQQGQPEAHAPPGKGLAHGYPQHTPPPGARRCPQGEGAEQIGRETSDAGAGSRELSTAQGTGRAEYAAQAAGSGGGEEGCVVERRGAEFVCVQGRLPQFTGGSTGLPWGSFGVWEEPWEEAAARETVDKLKNFWYQTGAHPLAVSAPPLSPQRNEPTNGVCGHAACAVRPFCVVERLGAVKAVYVEGRDQFRIKAIERSLQQLVQHPTPLDTDRDVEGVGLGTKSAEKVKEILRRGVSSRVEAVEGDEERQVTSRFLQVWGVGPSTAARWYAAGCRTLGDLRGRGDLTEQQKVGLKYYEDIQQRIPRAESAAAQRVVREACFKLCEEWGARDVDRCFAAVTGSFIRGKPTSGDVDILICLPPSLTGADCGAFLTQLLCRLVGSGFLLDEMSPRQPHAASERRASWMGMCRPPGAPCNRRIDVKVYGAPTAAFAVNYFANSMSFCRATRHWANHAVPQEAARYNPAATGFKISDAEMVPRRSASGRHRGRHRTEGPSSQDSGGEGGGEQLLWPAVPCRCESDIFNALQLAYVPPHMRFFHDYA